MKRLLSFLLIGCVHPVFGYIVAGGVGEIRATATAGGVNGAYYVSGLNASSVDYTQQDLAISSSTAWASTNGTTVPSIVTLSGATFGKDVIGNTLHCTAGTSWNTTLGHSFNTIIATDTASGGIMIADAAGVAASLSAGTCRIGGAASLNSTLDTDFFQAASSATATAGYKIWIKAGSLTLGENFTSTTAGNIDMPIIVEGYNTARGDTPTGSSRPSIATGANNFATVADWTFKNLSVTGSAASIFSIGINRLVNVDVLNNSTTAGRAAVLFAANARSTIINSSFMSERGPALSATNASAFVELYGCHVHHSSNAISGNFAGGNVVAIGNTFNSFIGPMFSNTGAHTVPSTLINNTFYGSNTQINPGYVEATGSSREGIFAGNIWDGFSIAINIVDAQSQTISKNEDFFNNSINYVNFSTSTTDKFVDPQFRNIVARSGTTATTTAGNHLVQSGATFQTWVITTSDIICIRAGTVITPGCYTIASIDSETQITTVETLTADATADKAWEIVQGNDFTPGVNLRISGFPGVSSDGIYTSYNDIGGIQHKDAPRAYAQ